MSSFDLYQTVTDQIVAMLESGVVPWRSPILGRSKGRASEESQHRQAISRRECLPAGVHHLRERVRLFLLADLQPGEGTRRKCEEGMRNRRWSSSGSSTRRPTSRPASRSRFPFSVITMCSMPSRLKASRSPTRLSLNRSTSNRLNRPSRSPPGISAGRSVCR